MLSFDIPFDQIHCEKLLQMLPVEVAVILQYYCESAVTCCEPTVKYLNLQ